MNPLRCLATVALLAGAPAWAKEPDTSRAGPWTLGTTVSLNVSQSSFSSDWKGGDRGSVVWVLASQATAERPFSPRFHLASQLRLAYGQASRQVADPSDPSRLVWDRPDKTTDQILLESVGRFTLARFVDPYIGLRVESQFQDRSSPLGTIEFNPIRLKESAGVARVIEKRKDREAITRIGFGFRHTFGRAFVDVSTRRSARSNDGGFEWQTHVSRPLLGGAVVYNGQLLAFQPVFYSRSGLLESFDAEAREADPAREAVADFWRATDIDFQNAFAAQITKSIGVHLFVQWVYDKFDAAAVLDPELPLPARILEVDRNVRKAGQFKETLALSFTFRLL